MEQKYTPKKWYLYIFILNMILFQIWNIQFGSLVRTLLSHQGPVWVLVCHGDLLLTASQDKTVNNLFLNVFIFQRILMPCEGLLVIKNIFKPGFVDIIENKEHTHTHTHIYIFIYIYWLIYRKTQPTN